MILKLALLVHQPMLERGKASLEAKILPRID